MTKILCTLGPSSLNPETIERLSELKVDLFRINLSHTPLDQIESSINFIREHSDVPISLDTQGAQPRTGQLAGDSVNLTHGTEVGLASGTFLGSPSRIPIYPDPFLGQLLEGDLLSIDFGTALLQIVEIKPNYIARVMRSGIIGSNKAMSIMDRPADLPPLTDADYTAVETGIRLGVENYALSFTNRPEDVDLLRGLVGSGANIISKIESRLALHNLKSILQVANAILIDRGDLSREVPLESLPFIQKEIIRQANDAQVPVYVATNLLESMITNPQPTRAEVNDVINTLIDGANGLVLAAETAIGRYPVQSVDMIQALVHQYESRTDASRAGAPVSLESIASSPRLIAPHGGQLIQRALTKRDVRALQDLPSLEVSENVIMDSQQIAAGAFSPLEGFMGRDALESVLANTRLPGGTVWPMPVLLQIPNSSPAATPANGLLALTRCGEPRALLHVEECFTYDLSRLAMRWFGTDDTDHPGVASLMRGSNRFVAGKVDMLPEDPSRQKAYELTPSQARRLFDHLGWQRIIGFHTRNVAHRAHEYIQLTSMSEYHGDGLFIHPIVGPKKAGEFSRDIILKTYQLLINKFYPPDKAVLSGFAAYPRYAGPREAVFTALCRQNFGCTHFVVGRDHTGVGNFYSPEASQRLFDEVSDISIKPIFFNEVYYCDSCETHREECTHGPSPDKRISGTQAREALNRGEILPDWYMRESVSQLILEELKNGTEVFTA